MLRRSSRALPRLARLARHNSTVPPAPPLAAAAPTLAPAEAAAPPVVLPPPPAEAAAIPVVLPPPPAPVVLPPPPTVYGPELPAAVSDAAAATAAAPPPPPLLPGELQTVPVPVLTPPPSEAVAEAAAAAVSDLASERAGGWFFGWPMAKCEALLMFVHDTSGLPWWATIVATTAAARLLIFPIQMQTSKNMAKLARIKPQIDAISEKVKAGYAKKTEAGMAEAARAQEELSGLMAKQNMSPFTPLFSAASVFIQFPLWTTLFFSLRHMVALPGLGLDTEGILWFKDLTVGDPYYILPATMSASFLAMIYVGDAGQAGTKDDEKQLMMKRFMMVMAPVIGVATANFEAGVFVYWSAANSLTLLQSAVLRVPAARAAVGLPPIPVHAAAAEPAALAAAPKPFIPAPDEIYSTPPPKAKKASASASAAAPEEVFSTPPPKAKAKQRGRKSKKKRG